MPQTELKEKYTEEHLSRKFKLEAYMDDGWVLSVSDINGNLVKQLEWSDFGFDDEDVFTSDEMREMGFEVV
jgi:hypothetical protein